MARILAVDDERAILDALARVLGRDGHEVVKAADPTAVPGMDLSRFDLVLCDVMMPGLDGFELVRQIRPDFDGPIIFLTARVAEEDAVAGYGLGADDYVRKPFGAAELRAKVAAHLRRERRPRSHALSFGEVRIDLGARGLAVGGEAVPLTPTEYAICEYLARHPGQVMSRAQIREAVLGWESDADDAAISMQVSRARRKLSEAGADPIATVWGMGYKWIGYTDVDSSGRGAGDGRAVYEGPQAPEAFHRRVQEADSRPLQRRQAQARDHGRVRPRQEHRGEVDQVDKRDRLAARRGQPHARAEPDPGARAREPQAPDGGRRLKTSGADIRSKVRAIAANEGRYPISAQCRLLGVARSTYYSMRSRADRPAAPDPAAPAVVAAHAASKGRYGSRKIKASLERSGVTVSRRRVCRIMRENGLVSAYGRKRFKVHPGAVNEADVPNVVARGFGGRAPRTHICSDLTYVRVGASWNYVCLLVDLYNREIVGHSAGPGKDARLVKSAFATLSFPISDIEVFHTDRGSEFDNAEIDLMLEAFGIERSLSAKGCPYDNAVDESTNRILKAELVHRETFGTTRELRAKLSDYVHWYNNFRIHSTLGYMSPVEFREAGLSLPESSK